MNEELKRMNKAQKDMLVQMIIIAVRDPYHYVIPVKSLVRQLWFRNKMIDRLEKGDNT